MPNSEPVTTIFILTSTFYKLHKCNILLFLYACLCSWVSLWAPGAYMFLRRPGGIKHTGNRVTGNCGLPDISAGN